MSEYFTSRYKGDGLPYNLIDISMGGMAFLHLIGSLPVSVVADRKLTDSSRLRRRCSVRFGELTNEQRVQLQGLISRHSGLFPILSF